MRRHAALALTVALLGCAAATPNLPTPPGGAVVVSSEEALAFRRRVEGFYPRLAHRRFNALETFNDYIMREHFQTPDLFFDYYADLAQALVEADFEKSRPLSVEVEEFLFEDARTAQVQVRFVGYDDRPLRPGRTSLVRIDRWERVEGVWWIRPGKL